MFGWIKGRAYLWITNVDIWCHYLRVSRYLCLQFLCTLLVWDLIGGSLWPLEPLAKVNLGSFVESVECLCASCLQTLAMSTFDISKCIDGLLGEQVHFIRTNLILVSILFGHLS